jgi:hypothetical protein
VIQFRDPGKAHNRDDTGGRHLILGLVLLDDHPLYLFSDHVGIMISCRFGVTSPSKMRETIICTELCDCRSRMTTRYAMMTYRLKRCHPKKGGGILSDATQNAYKHDLGQIP